MSIAIKQDALQTALQQVMGVVENNKTIPILSNILVRTQGDIASVTATDLGIEITGYSKLNTPLDEDISFTVPGKKTFDICKSLPQNADISFKPQKSNVLLRYGDKCRFTLATLPAEDFPSVDQTDNNISVTLPQNQLKTLLQRTVFAMAHQDVRYYLNGMLLEFSANDIRAVATDGHRLATNTISLPVNTDHKLQCIIPRKAVTELIKLLDSSDTLVTMTICHNFISVASNSFHFKSKLIEGRFPEYERVIPYGNDKSLSINRTELKNMLSRAAIMCNDAFRGVTLEIKQNCIKVSSNNPENEAAEQELPVNYTNDPMSIGFNVSYLIENLNILETDDIELKLANQDQSMLITEVGSEHDSVFVIMPMRI